MVRTGAKIRKAPRPSGLLLFLLCLPLVVSGCTTTKKQKEIADSRLLTGIAYLGERQDIEALRCFLEAEALAPRNERLHYFKAFVFVNQGNFDEAMVSLRRAISLNGSYAQAQTFLGSLYLRSGEDDKAMELFQKALANPLYDAPAAALYGIGWIHFRKGENQKASAACLRALAIDPHSPLRARVLMLLGEMALLDGDYQAALARYQEATVLIPDDLEALLGLARSHLGLNDKKAAKRLLDKIIAADREGEIAAKAREVLRMPEGKRGIFTHGSR